MEEERKPRLALDEMGNPISILERYGEDLTNKKYITNPAIAREMEIKRLIMILLTPEKSAILVGKPGIGKTALVEGLAYLMQEGHIPDALKGYRIIKLGSTSLLGKTNTKDGPEVRIQLLIEELKVVDHVILFIDEIHTLMGGKGDGPMDLANMLKPGLDRGTIKVIGATTTEEFEHYVIRDRAFLRRFERVDIAEPDEKTTVAILMGTLKKIEAQTGAKIKYNEYITSKIMESIVSATSEFKRVYELSARYPDIALSVLTQAFSQALFENSKEVNIKHFYNAIKTSKRIYPDSIIKELALFKEKFQKVCELENIVLEDVKLEDISDSNE